MSNDEDLRDKISSILSDWKESIEFFNEIKNRCTYCVDDYITITDKILSVLPKVPKLRWGKHSSLMLGNIKVGSVTRVVDGSWCGGTTDEWVIWNAPTKEDAQAAVEKAVYTALEWE